MSYLNALLADLRNRKVWPIAAVLVAALVAIPVLLRKTPAPAPVTGPIAALPVASAKDVPSVTAATSPAQAAEKGNARDPFAQPGVPATPATSSSAPLASAAAAVSSAANSVAASASGATSVPSSTASATAPAISTATGGSTGTSSTYTGPGIVTPPVVPGGTTTSTSKPLAPSTPSLPASGLTARQHYAVTLAVTNASGGFDTIDPFERDGAIPSDSSPWLVQLGVLSGGGRVLFAVAANATPSGPATCLPGPLDCEVLSVVPGQNETISAPNGTPVTFQITGVSAVTDASAAAAKSARNQADATGSGLLAGWQRPAFSLFPYVPSQGVVDDERNVIVGGN